MTSCFGAIDTLVRHADSSKGVVIDGAILPDTNVEAVDAKNVEADKTYENYGKVQEDFHDGIETPATGNERNRIPPKRKLLEKIANVHANIAEQLHARDSLLARKNAAVNRQIASLINEALKIPEVHRGY